MIQEKLPEENILDGDGEAAPPTCRYVTPR